MKSILITGGAGFIGSNLTSHLLKLPGIKVICFDNFDPFYSHQRKEQNIAPFLGDGNYQVITGDICNLADLSKIDQKIDVIVHLAGKAGVRYSIHDPIGYNRVNHGGTQMLLEFAKNNDVKQFIFASSSSVYGNSKAYPWSEKDIVLPISPYASSKLSSENLGHVYSYLYGIRFLALRLFTVYGPGQRPDLAIFQFYDAIVHERPLNIFGDGSSSRDYTFVEDTVSAISAAISYQKTMFEIFNVGNNQSISLEMLIGEIENVTQKKAILLRHPKQVGDVDHTLANIEKANHFLDYTPQTDLKKGLYLFSKWYRTNFENVLST